MKSKSENATHYDGLAELQECARRIIDLDDRMTTVERRKNYEQYLSLYSDLENFAWDQGYRLNGPEITGRVLEDISMITVFCRDLDDILEKEKPLRKFGLEHGVRDIVSGKAKLLDKLEVTDKFKVQILLNEIRDILQKSNYFSERQQFRLLVRLEKMQRALHRSVSVLEDLF
jgi:hypothetical protein